MRTVFVNPERCIGCRQCELACAVEHSVSKEMTTAFLESPVPRTRVHVEQGPIPTFSFPNRCRHCDPAPCVAVCPTAALYRDDDKGLVLVDERKCIGCAMCALVCPFDVVTFHPQPDGPGPDVAVAVKCDGCAERVGRGEEPACTEVCKVDALVYGDLNELVTAGRLRETASVLAAATTSPAPFPEGDPLAGWHAWGEASAEAAADAAGWEGPVTNGRHDGHAGADAPGDVESEGGKQ